MIRKSLLLIFILSLYSFVFAQESEEYFDDTEIDIQNTVEMTDVEITQENEEEYLDDTEINIQNTVEMTNIVQTTNKITVEITNTIVIQVPSIVPASINACVAILRDRFEDLELFISRDRSIVSNIRSDGNTLLHIAASVSNTNIINYLISSGVPINQTNDSGQTPLHIAAQINNIQGIETLLRANALVNIKDNLDQTPVWIANIKGYPQILKLLALAQMEQALPNQNEVIATLKKTNNISKIPSNFDLYANFAKKIADYGPILQTPWHQALYVLGYNEAEKLINAGITPYITDNKGQNALHIAAIYDNFDALKYLLTIDPLSLSTTDNFGATPLHTAAGKSSTETVKTLIDVGCNIYKKNKGGWTPFFESVLLNNQAVVRYFIEQGVSPNTRSPKGRTPLHEAARLGYDFIVRDLLNSGALFNVADYQGKTPLFLAAEQGNTEIVAQLYEKGADVNLTTSEETTALHAAVLNNQVGTVKYLIDIGKMDFLQEDNLGRTALDIAYIRGFDEIVSYLALKYAEAQIKK